jgi:GNAT superfamily N-acetyltransferase
MDLTEASRADVPALVQLVQSAYRGEESRRGWTTEASLLAGQRTDASAVLELLSAPNSRILVGTQDGQLTACVHLKQTGECLNFGMFAVAPRLQGAGIGTRMIQEVERRALAVWGCRCIRMHVIALRTELIAFYTRRGYLPTGERAPFPYGDERFGLPLRPDLEFVVLEKHLD